jgi:hypothetical protein
MDRTGLKKPALGILAAILALPIVAGTAAAASRSAATASARDFLTGDFRGTALSATGRLTVGPSLTASGWPEDAAGATVFGAASDARGRVFVATGGGQGRLFVAEGGKVTLLFTAPEPNVTAVAVAPDGTVVCGTSPDGKLYSVDVASKDAAGSGKAWGSPGEAAIWSLAFGPDGSLFAGTGAKGRIYRRDRTGKLDLFFEAEDLHVRSLAVAPGGVVYAGTSDKGLVLAIQPDGKARTLYDSEKPEVTALVVARDGSLFAAAVQADAAASPASRLDLKRPAAPAPAPTPAPARDETPRGTVSVSTSTARPILTNASSSGNSSEIVVIRPDGFVEPAWTLPEDVVYAMRLDSASGGLVLSTGPRGRIYSLVDRHLTLEAQTEERAVVSTLAGTAGLAAVTSGGPGVFAERRGGPVRSGTYTAAVKDAGRLAVFGRLRFEGEAGPDGSAAFWARSGNSVKPDATWSPWVPLNGNGRPEGKTGGQLPAARFFQWKVELKASEGKAGPSLERVEFSYADRNARPVLENLMVLEPGAVFPRAGASSGPSVLSVTNPDENGIFAGVEPPKETADAAGRKLFRKGFRTFTWKGTDPNGDPLRYQVDLRPASGGAPFVIRKEIEEPYLSFDTTAIPDGRYRFRVTASDRPGNPEGDALTASEESDLFVVDNTPPSIRVESRSVEGGELVLRLVASDLLSPIAKAEGSVNADRWRLLAADDGAFDSSVEPFTMRVAVPSGNALLGVRIVDGAGNVAAIAVEYPKDFPGR